MKKKIIVLTVAILLISPYTISSIFEFSETTPDILLPCEFLANITNSTFEIVTEGFKEEDVNIIKDNSESNIEPGKYKPMVETGKALLVLFYCASLFNQLDSIERFNPLSFIKSVLLLLVGLWLINNIEIIFNLINYLREIIVGKLEFDNRRLINFNEIIKDYNMNVNRADILSKKEEVMLIISYYITITMTLVVSLIIGVIMFLRIIKLKIYQLIAPIMISPVSYKGTINLTLAFIKDYAITYFMIILIIIFINTFMQFGVTLRVSKFLYALQGMVMGIVVIKIKSISMKCIKISKMSIKTFNTIRKSDNKIKTITSLTRGKLNTAGYADLVNKFPSKSLGYMKKRMGQTSVIFSKEGRKAITAERMYSEAKKFTKETYTDLRKRLNNMGYAPVVNKLPSQIANIFKKGD